MPNIGQGMFAGASGQGADLPTLPADRKTGADRPSFPCRRETTHPPGADLPGLPCLLAHEPIRQPTDHHPGTHEAADRA
jgi:hypothetical protein